MDQIFLVAVTVTNAKAGSSMAFLELIFFNDVPFAVFDWDDVRERRPRMTVELDPRLLKPAQGKADYIYEEAILDPRKVATFDVISRAIH